MLVIAKDSLAVSVVYELQRNKTRQSIIGFGGAFTDSAGINIASLPQAARDKLIRSYFAPEGEIHNSMPSYGYILCFTVLGAPK